MKKIVLTGGGTAGHIYPALALVDDLKKEFKAYEKEVKKQIKEEEEALMAKEVKEEETKEEKNDN